MNKISDNNSGISVDIPNNSEFYDNSLLQHVFENSSIAICVTNEKNELIINNKAFRKLFGYSNKDAITGKTFIDFISSSDKVNTLQYLAENKNGKKTPKKFDVCGKKKDGAEFFAKVNMAKVKSKSNYLNIFHFIKITKHIQIQKYQQIESDILEIFNKTENDENAIMEMTRIIRNELNIESIGIRLRKENDFPYYYTIGFPEKFVDTEKYLCKCNDNGDILIDSSGNPVHECLCGKVIHKRFNQKLPYFTKNGSFWTNSFTEFLKALPEEHLKSLRRSCVNEGYESIALIPLHTKNEVLGLLQLNDKRPNFYNLDMILSLESICNGLSIVFSQRNALKKLKDSEREFRSLFEHAAIPIWVEDFSLIKNYFNELKLNGVDDFSLYFNKCPEEVIYCASLIRLLNVNCESLKFFKANSKEEIIRNTPKYFTEDSWPVFKEELICLAEGKTYFERETSVNNMAGERQEVIFKLSVEPEYKDTLERVLVSFMDITSRKNIEQKLMQSHEDLEKEVYSRTVDLVKAYKTLKESEERFRTIADYTYDWEFWISPEGKFIYVSPSAERITGYKPDKFSDEKEMTDAIVIPEDRELIQAHFKHVCTEQGISEINFRIKRQDGAIRWIHHICQAVYSKDGRILGRRASNRDITEKKFAEIALIESEKRYHHLLSSVTNYVYTIYVKNKITTKSIHREECKKITGYSPLDFETDPNLWSKLIYSSDKNFVSDMTARLFQINKKISFEHRIVHKDGNILWISNTLVPHFDATGQLNSYDGIVVDITERKKAVEALQESEHKFRSLLKQAGDGFELANSEGRFIEVNKTSCDMLGYSKEELLSLTISDIDPNFPPERYQSVFKSLIGMPPTTFETTHRRKDGSIFPVEVTTSIIQFEQSSYTMAFIRDITERKQTEEKLFQSEQRFRQMADNMQEIFFLFEKKGDKLLYINKVAEKILCIPFDKIQNDHLLIFGAIHPDDLSSVKFANPSIFYSEPLNEEFRVICPNDEIRWVRLRSFLIHNEKGEIIRIAGLIADISEFKKFQEQTKLQQMQLIQAEKMASLGVLVAGVAHEINNPNNFIMLNAPLLREAWKDAVPILDSYLKSNGDFLIAGIEYSIMSSNILQMIGSIEKGAKRIQAIVKNLKEYARVDEHESFRAIEINEIVKNAIEIIEYIIRKKTRNFTLNLYPEPLMIYGSFQNIEQVIINLVQNACEALTNSEQKISVTTHLNKDDMLIEIIVKDEGCGIAPENLTKITDPFFTTKIKTGGTGLGLSVSLGLLKNHGGDLKFDSKPGEGTTVTLTLPIKAD